MRHLPSFLLPTVAVLSVCITSAQEISLPEDFRQQKFDVVRYDADIRFETVTDKHVSGVVRMAVKWIAPSTSPILYANLLGCTIDSALVRGQRVSPMLQGAAVSPTDSMRYFSFALPHNVSANDADTLVVYYSGTMTDEGGAQPWGGVHYSDQTLYALGVGFHSTQVSTTQHWLPCYDHPSDKAMFRGTFDVPSNYDVASVGTRSKDTIANGRRIVEWTTAEPFSTYLLTFAVAPYVLLKSNEGSLPIEIYTLARDTASAGISFRLLPRMIRTFASRFGTYPFEKVGYCATAIGAMEHQTMISYPVSLIQARDTINDVAAHELAHQWFGDLVTPLDFRHTWLTESFATLSENLWREELFGSTSYLNVMSGRIDRYIKTISKAEGVFPLYDFPRKAPSSNYPETIYQKGAVVLGMLRWHLGDSAFFGGLQLYLQTHYNGNATTDDMKTALETASGRNLTAFFDEWVLGKGWPKLAVTYRRNGSGWDVEMQQVQNQLDPSIPVFTTLPVNVRYFDAQDRDVDTVFLPDISGRFTFSAKKLTGINNGTKVRSLLEVVQTVGVDETGPIARRISISPNPAVDACTIERATTATDAYVTIVDSVGRTLISKVIDAGATTATLSLVELAEGAYIVRVVEDGQPLSLPLIVTR